MVGNPAHANALHFSPIVVKLIVFEIVALCGFGCDKTYFRLVSLDDINVHSSVPMGYVNPERVIVYAHFLVLFLFLDLPAVRIAIAMACF
jgi:hypothetical protein